MKTWHWVILYSIALLVIGCLIGRATIKRQEIIVEYLPETTWVHDYIHDKEQACLGYAAGFKSKPKKADYSLRWAR